MFTSSWWTSSFSLTIQKREHILEGIVVHELLPQRIVLFRWRRLHVEASELVEMVFLIILSLLPIFVDLLDVHHLLLGVHLEVIASNIIDGLVLPLLHYLY